MNEFFTQFKNKARAVKLRADEKQAMRVRLYTYFERNTIGDFTAPVQKIYKPIPSMYYWFSPRYMVPVALILIIGLSGGTAFAAESALPGQPLYAVKINVNEPVQVALATTPQAKAQVNASIATTRLEEAESLASAGRLDATTAAQLASNFAQHAAAAQASTATLAAQDPSTAAQIGTEFDSTLAAHGAILAQLGDDSSSTSTMQDSNALAVQVQQTASADSAATATDEGAASGEAVAIATAPAPVAASATAPAAYAPMMLTATATRQDQEGSSTASTSANTAPTTLAAPAPAAPATPDNIKENSQIAIALGTEASTSLAATMQDFAALPALDATTSSQVTAQLQEMQHLYASSSAELSTGSFTQATADFTRVLRTSVKLDAYLKAGKQFNIRLLTGLLDRHAATSTISL